MCRVPTRRRGVAAVPFVFVVATASCFTPADASTAATSGAHGRASDADAATAPLPGLRLEPPAGPPPRLLGPARPVDAELERLADHPDTYPGGACWCRWNERGYVDADACLDALHAGPARRSCHDAAARSAAATDLAAAVCRARTLEAYERCVAPVSCVDAHRALACDAAFTVAATACPALGQHLREAFGACNALHRVAPDGLADTVWTTRRGDGGYGCRAGEHCLTIATAFLSDGTTRLYHEATTPRPDGPDDRRASCVRGRWWPTDSAVAIDHGRITIVRPDVRGDVARLEGLALFDPDRTFVTTDFTYVAVSGDPDALFRDQFGCR